MYTYPLPYLIKSNSSVAVTAVAQNVDLGTNTAYLHNVGTGKVFISPSSSDNTKWELAVGEKLPFPITGVISVASDTTATLKILIVDVLG